jgi:hypothetical protein
MPIWANVYSTSMPGRSLLASTTALLVVEVAPPTPST